MRCGIVISLPCNVIGMLCIIYKTPQTAKSLSYRMLSVSVWTFITEISLSWLVTPVLMLPVFGYYPNGLLRLLNIPTYAQTWLIAQGILG
ncbi:hypothetical protein WR25_26780 [Diploscapter pachys]|uniref:Uncharacterized protein n=1 Tax=Diploscapter pachys TaxID=2018661 RepID=A0A2A2KSD0_9BILA|nr:hypothetical protein WR25_26780 [Diploscapter pachys]